MIDPVYSAAENRYEKMTYRRSGRSGIQIPVLLFCMGLICLLAFCRMDKCHNPRRNCGTLLWFCNLRFVPFVHPPFFVYQFLLFRIYLSIFLIFSVHYRTEDKVFSRFPVPSVPLKRRNSNPSSGNYQNDKLPFHAVFFNDRSYFYVSYFKTLTSL